MTKKSSDRPEAADGFAVLLDWHLQNGTNEPQGRQRWSRQGFADRAGFDKGTVIAWINDGVLPQEQNLAIIEQTLFGVRGTNPVLDEYRKELHAAWLSASAGSPLRASLLRFLARGEIGARMAELSKQYDAAEHELIRLSAERIISKVVARFEFRKDVGPVIDHLDFGFLTAPYIAEKVRSVRALTRTSVTDWRDLNSASQKVLTGQKNKDVVRIFAMSSLEECVEYAASVFPMHECIYRAENLLVCSSADLTALIEKCPDDERIAENEDFALYDDAVAAICTGPSQMRFTTNSTSLRACRTVFDAVETYSRGRGQTLAGLKSGDKWAEIFHKPA